MDHSIFTHILFEVQTVVICDVVGTYEAVYSYYSWGLKYLLAVLWACTMQSTAILVRVVFESL